MCSCVRLGCPGPQPASGSLPAAGNNKSAPGVNLCREAAGLEGAGPARANPPDAGSVASAGSITKLAGLTSRWMKPSACTCSSAFSMLAATTCVVERMQDPPGLCSMGAAAGRSRAASQRPPASPAGHGPSTTAWREEAWALVPQRCCRPATPPPKPPNWTPPLRRRQGCLRCPAFDMLRAGPALHLGCCRLQRTAQRAAPDRAQVWPQQVHHHVEAPPCATQCGNSSLTRGTGFGERHTDSGDCIACTAPPA